MNSIPRRGKAKTSFVCAGYLWLDLVLEIIMNGTGANVQSTSTMTATSALSVSSSSIEKSSKRSRKEGQVGKKKRKKSKKNGGMRATEFDASQQLWVAGFSKKHNSKKKATGLVHYLLPKSFHPPLMLGFRRKSYRVLWIFTVFQVLYTFFIQT